MHRGLNNTIRNGFKWYPGFGIILDWYHRVKKGKEFLRISLGGCIIQNEVLSDIMPLLWHGPTDQAIEKLKQIKHSKIKNDEKLAKLMDQDK